MRWTVRGVSSQAIDDVRAMADHFGSQGAVLEAAIRRLYDSKEWPDRSDKAPVDCPGSIEVWEEYNRESWALLDQLQALIDARTKGSAETSSEAPTQEPQG